MTRRFLLSFPYGTTEDVLRVCRGSSDAALSSLTRVVVLKSRTLCNGASFPMVLVTSKFPNSCWLIYDAFDLVGLTPSRCTFLHAPIDVVVHSYPAGSVLYDSKEM